jgi:hypothetical protein
MALNASKILKLTLNSGRTGRKTVRICRTYGGQHNYQINKDKLHGRTGSTSKGEVTEDTEDLLTQ